MLTVAARKAGTSVFNEAQVSVMVAPAVPHMALETPTTPYATLPQPFMMTGWAIDAGTASGTGVQRVQILAYPNPGSGTPPIVVGNATYGGSRPDVQTAYASYGSGFTPSGFSHEIRGLTPGVYRLVAQALSTVTGTSNQSREITVTVAANPAMWIDAPAHGSSVNHTFTMVGWAIDAAAATGTGVNTVHVWATPSGGSATFLGAATYGSARGDIATTYGSQFLNSGWSLTTTLSPGVYQLTAYAYSLVSGGFTLAQSVTVTVATSVPGIAIDAPAAGVTVAQPFGITGWAVDVGAPAGTGPGMDAVHIYAIANSGAGAWTFLGAATYGGARPDVAAYFGNAQFTNSGYGLTASGLAPGTYLINVYAHSTVSGQWAVSQRVVTVQ
jgi:hypothetical protein